jgi:hypothetical protein
VDDSDYNFAFSGGKAVVATSKSTPPQITLSVNVKESGPYVLDGQLMASKDGGLMETVVDSRTIDGSVDLRAPDSRVISMQKVADLPWLAKGRHTITFRLRDDGNRKYEFGVDCIRLRDKDLFEGEQMKVLANSGDPLDEQTLQGFGDQWSNNAQLWFRPSKPGASFTLELPVESKRVAIIGIYFTKAADYGIVQVKLDGKPIGQAFDGYNDGVVRSNLIPLGLFNLDAGSHQLTFEVIGKNPRSTSYMVGVDAVVLR